LFLIQRKEVKAMKGRFCKAWVMTLLLLCSSWGLACSETLYVQRPKVEVKQGKGSFYPTVYEARQGEALETILEEGGWYQVRMPRGQGWVFGKALGEKKDSGFSPLTKLVGTSDPAETDKVAGFKGFDRATEVEYVSSQNLTAQMQLVDQLQKPPFTVAELEGFMQNGRLGQGREKP
jgi:uncharacterized protein YraI